MNYITGGSGFVGKELLKIVEAVNIPHEEIDTVKLEPFDDFYFCSAYGNMSDHTDNYKIIKANVLDPITILKKASNFKSFTYISTSSVTLPVQTMYSRTKKATEEILQGFDLPITIVRPFSITGVGEQENHLIPTLIRSALNGDTVRLCNGSHDFINVTDFVNGIVALRGRSGVFELGTGIKTTNEEVLRIVERVTGKKIKVTKVESLRKYDSPDWVCKNFEAHKYWKPQKTLEISIKEMYDQIRTNN